VPLVGQCASQPVSPRGERGPETPRVPARAAFWKSGPAVMASVSRITGWLPTMALGDGPEGAAKFVAETPPPRRGFRPPVVAQGAAGSASMSDGCHENHAAVAVAPDVSGVLSGCS